MDDGEKIKFQTITFINDQQGAGEMQFFLPPKDLPLPKMGSNGVAPAPVEITPQQIGEVVNSLCWYAVWRRTERLALFSRYTNADVDDQEPSLEKVVGEYQALPDGHPLRTDERRMLRGYRKVCRENEQGRGYASLGSFRSYVEKNHKPKNPIPLGEEW